MNVQQFTTVPLHVQAVQWDGSAEQGLEIEAWSDHAITYLPGPGPHLAVDSSHTADFCFAQKDDWLIYTGSGEYYVERPWSFDEKYRPDST